jgi:type I restriction enzyme, S subunit
MTPDGWLETTIGRLTQVRRGASPRPIQDPRWFSDVGPGWVRISDVSRSKRVLTETEQRLSSDGVARSIRLGPGDLILSIAATIGKPIVLGIEACIHDGFVYFPDLDDRCVNRSFLYYFFQAKQSDLARRGQPGTQKNINTGIVEAIGIQLPPLDEQRKIAAILSAVDDAIEQTQAVIDELQVVKKALMTELLTRGLPGRHTRFKQTEIGEIPADWQVVRAGELCELITKGATPRDQTRDVGEVPFLKVYNINPDGFVDFRYQPTFIPRSTHQRELKRSRVVPGDVLMNIVGPPLGKVAVVPSDHREWNINQAIALFRSVRVEPGYLALCLAAPTLFTWLLSRAKRTSTQLNLTLELCRDYPIPLPPESERNEIIGAISVIDTRLREEIAASNGLREAKVVLMPALLTGELRVTPDEATA